MHKLIEFLKKIDTNLVKITLIGFIFLVPLWPKLPIKTIDYTYISIRLEDIYFVFMMFIFFVQLIRKKIVLNKIYLSLFMLFWLSVNISSLWGIYISKSFQFQHLGLLHSLRRIEYMSLFFIAVSVIKNKKDFFQLANLYIFAVFITVIYGLGQKFLNFPAVQTMNPEYAKGYLLYLTPEARISSTFAGHYDFASYLVFAIPIILGFYFFSDRKRYLGLFIGALIVLIYTSSRISFGAYVIAVFGLLIFIKRYWFALFTLLLTAALMFVTGDLTNRFLKTLQVKRILIDDRTGTVYIGQKITTKELPAGSFYVRLNNQSGKNLGGNLEVLKKQVTEQKALEATISGEISEGQQEAYIASLAANLKPVNTVVSDISFATRLQVEWPRAIEAFLSNPILGKGPSSITEATDNDYLRWLGELGLSGTLLFLLIIFNIVKTIWLKIYKSFNKNRLLGLGFLFGLVALMFNATYIDVFEASKVAYTFWTVAGLFIGYFTLKTSSKLHQQK